MTNTAHTFTIDRTYAAPAQTLWNVWTDPDSVVGFLHDGRTQIDRDSIVLNPRVGGRFRYDVVRPELDDRVRVDGVFLDLVPFKRVQFSWAFPGAEGDDIPVVTVTMKEHGVAADGGPNETTLQLTVSGFSGGPGDRFYDGWVDVLASLDAYLASSLVS